MSGEDDDDSKEHEPSQKRIDDARARGEIPRSADLLTGASYAGLLLGAVLAGGFALRRAGQAGAALLDQADSLAPQALRAGPAALVALTGAFGLPFVIFLALPGVAVLLVLAIQRGMIFTPAKLMPKVSRINPLANARQKFGLDGMVEFAKSSGKLVLVSVLLAIFLGGRGSRILSSMQMSPGQAIALLLDLMVRFLLLVTLIAVTLGGGDYLWQMMRHRSRNRMSRKEVMDEAKESDGDPHAKAQRRQRGQEIALNQMLADVAKADVIVVNPTHYAVALKWNRASRQAPVCVAKGVDAVAARIRERAAEHGIPVHSDPPTARAIHAAVDIGQQIRPEHYRAVAAAIRFSEHMRKQARRWPK
jgi:flagellar biosynthesis protein FlhB